MSPWWDKNWFKEDYLRQFHTPRTSDMDVDIPRGYSIKDWLFLFQSRPDFQLKIYSLPVLHRVLLGSLTVTNRGGILSRSLHALFEEVAWHFHVKDCLIIAYGQCAADLVNGARYFKGAKKPRIKLMRLSFFFFFFEIKVEHSLKTVASLLIAPRKKVKLAETTYKESRVN